ncbi:MAG: hypothetical protein K6G61_04335 [Solobacterium sp.]|nr:hypothetical protein [Solobacterium sp.]
MKKTLSFLAAVSLILTGCASGGAASAASSAGSAQAEEQETEEQNTEEQDKEETAAITDDSVKTLSLNLPALSGGLGQLQLQEKTDLSEEETAEANRAMRAYSPISTPLINNAEHFYYYEQLDSTAQKIYDAMLLAVENPADPNNIVIYSTTDDIETPEFADALWLAYYAMLYDHPELFWLYNDTKATMNFGVPYVPSAPGTNELYIYFEEPYEDFEEDVQAFNDAAEKFLSDIDLTASEAEIALAIHDKLIETVTYDYDVMASGTAKDLAHTAYGALVENSRGDKKTAVCDGYSLAYEYLLQQAGLEAAVIVGTAGNDPSDLGGHAWSIVKVDGEWYEVDSTWDDAGSLDDMLEDYKTTDAYPYYREALDDVTYRDAIQHYLFEVPTATMESFVLTDEYYYSSKDGLYSYTILSDGIHVRASEDSEWFPYNKLIETAPIAE